MEVEKQTKEESSRVYHCKDERVKKLVNSRIRKMDRIGMKRSKRSCAVRPREGSSYAVSKFRRAVNMKIAVEY